MKNKVLMVFLSVAIAFGLWLYVINFVSLDSEESYYNIPVGLTGESALEDKGLMITGGRNTTVSLRLSGKRSDLINLNSSNITIEADLSKIYDPGEKVELVYDIRYPGSTPQTAFEVLEQTPGVITLSIETRVGKYVPIVVDYGGTTQPEEYMALLEEASLSEEQVWVTGPKSIMDQITKAMIRVDLTDRTESFSEEYRYTLCNGQGEPVDLKELVSVDDDGKVRLDLSILRLKMVPLWIEVIGGGGATPDNSTILINPVEFQIAGNEQVLQQIERIELIGQIRLGEIDGETTLTFPIDVPDKVVNISGLTEAEVTVSFPNLATKVLNVKNFEAINVPEGMEAEILTKDLPITFRGPATLIGLMEENDVVVVVDFTNAPMGTATVKATIRLLGEFTAVGEMDSYSVTATLREAPPEEP